MIEVFNTSFELSLRVLLILKIAKKKMSAERITALDFISIYGKDFGVSDYNLHGDNNYRFSEYASKRQIVKRALKELVLKGYVQPSCNKSGFSYSISNEGMLFCGKLNDEYADKFSSVVENAINKYSDYSDRKIIYCINDYAVARFGGQKI